MSPVIILQHDRELFDLPRGWKIKKLFDSPLISDFDIIWKELTEKYTTELRALAYTDIPDEREIAVTIKKLIQLLH